MRMYIEEGVHVSLAMCIHIEAWVHVGRMNPCVTYCVYTYRRMGTFAKNEYMCILLCVYI